MKLGFSLGRLLAGLLLLACAASAALAVSTVPVAVPARVWTDLGAGPMLVEAGDRSIPVRFAISDQMPVSSQVGFLSNIRSFQTGSHVWAWSTQNNTVTVAPIAPVAGGSTGTALSVPLASGTGGVVATPLGTTPRQVIAKAAGVRISLFFYNQAPPGGPTVTVCQAGGPAPAAYVPGCFTLQPGGGYLSYPASGYVPQDAWNAVASAANTAFTVEAH